MFLVLFLCLRMYVFSVCLFYAFSANVRFVFSYKILTYCTGVAVFFLCICSYCR